MSCTNTQHKDNEPTMYPGGKRQLEYLVELLVKGHNIKARNNKQLLVKAGLHLNVIFPPLCFNEKKNYAHLMNPC